MFLSGCASTTSKPGVIQAYTMPKVTTELDPEANLAGYASFNLCPVAHLVEKTTMSPIVEKQLLFVTRNYLERLGYKNVDSVDRADFYVGLVYANEFGSIYEPPSIRTIPWYIPGQTQTTNVNLYGSTGYYWGTATTQTPGQYVPLTYSTPGQYINYYMPCIHIILVDKKSNKIAWQATGLFATPESDVRKSGQYLIGELLIGHGERRLPVCTEWGKRADVNDGSFGVDFDVLTTNGNDFYPVVSRLWIDSPAHKQGLRLYDTLSHINGTSTLNTLVSEIRRMLDQHRGERTSMAVKRGKKSVEILLVAESEEVARTTWRKYKTTNERAKIVIMTVDDILSRYEVANREEYLSLIP
jgi:hypothetical protein